MNYEQEIEYYSNERINALNRGDKIEYKRLDTAIVELQKQKCLKNIFEIEMELALKPKGRMSELKKFLKEETKFFQDLIKYRSN